MHAARYGGAAAFLELSGDAIADGDAVALGLHVDVGGFAFDGFGDQSIDELFDFFAAGGVGAVADVRVVGDPLDVLDLGFDGGACALLWSELVGEAIEDGAVVAVGEGEGSDLDAANDAADLVEAAEIVGVGARHGEHAVFDVHRDHLVGFQDVPWDEAIDLGVDLDLRRVDHVLAAFAVQEVDALSEDLCDGEGHLRDALDDAVEGVASEEEAAGGFEGLTGGGSSVFADDGHLTEDLTAAELGELELEAEGAVDQEHAYGAGADDVQGVADRAFFENDLTRVVDAGLEAFCDLREEVAADAFEQGDFGEERADLVEGGESGREHGARYRGKEGRESGAKRGWFAERPPWSERLASR